MVIYGKNQTKAKKKPPEGGFKLLAEEASNHPYVGFRQLCIGILVNRYPKLPYLLKITRIT
jgi:hypothetical protein